LKPKSQQPKTKSQDPNSKFQKIRTKNSKTKIPENPGNRQQAMGKHLETRSQDQYQKQSRLPGLDFNLFFCDFIICDLFGTSYLIFWIFGN
jgi:hypothetical protein